MKNIYKQKHTKKRKSDGLTSCNKSTNKQKLFNRPMENSFLTNASTYTNSHYTDTSIGKIAFEG